MNCKWCGEITSFPDSECHECWEFLHRLDHALHTEKLFTMLKEKVSTRILEIHREGHF